MSTHPIPRLAPAATFTGASRIDLELVDSTNRYAWEQLSSGRNLPEGTLINAYHQYAGRGQRGTTWQAEPGQNLTLSVVYYPDFLQASHLFYLNKLVALAVTHTLEEYFGADEVKIKWPNDIYVLGKKSAGLLIENQLSGNQLEVTVIGIGLNINQASFPPELVDRSTSMARSLGYTLRISEVLEKLLGWLEYFYLSLKASKSAILDHTYLARLYRYQEWASFMGPDDNVFKGMIVGVTQDGRLAMQQEGEGLVYYGFKEVRFL